MGERSCFKEIVSLYISNHTKPNRIKLNHERASLFKLFLLDIYGELS